VKLFENKDWEEDKIVIHRNSFLLFLRDQEKKQKKSFEIGTRDSILRRAQAGITPAA